MISCGLRYCCTSNPLQYFWLIVACPTRNWLCFECGYRYIRFKEIVRQNEESNSNKLAVESPMASDGLKIRDFLNFYPMGVFFEKNKTQNYTAWYTSRALSKSCLISLLHLCCQCSDTSTNVATTNYIFIHMKQPESNCIKTRENWWNVLNLMILCL